MFGPTDRIVGFISRRTLSATAVAAVPSTQVSFGLAQGDALALSICSAGPDGTFTARTSAAVIAAFLVDAVRDAFALTNTVRTCTPAGTGTVAFAAATIGVAALLALTDRSTRRAGAVNAGLAVLAFPARAPAAIRTAFLRGTSAVQAPRRTRLALPIDAGLSRSALPAEIAAAVIPAYVVVA